MLQFQVMALPLGVGDNTRTLFRIVRLEFAVSNATVIVPSVTSTPDTYLPAIEVLFARPADRLSGGKEPRLL